MKMLPANWRVTPFLVFKEVSQTGMNESCCASESFVHSLDAAIMEMSDPSMLIHRAL